MDKRIEQLKQAVFDRKPVLREIYQKARSRSLYDYVNSWQGGSKAIDPVFKKHFRSLAEKIYDSVTAKQLAAQLESRPIISTIDHHGLLNHPFFLNSNLIYSLSQNIDYCICLPTAGVSLNNSSWPGSLCFTNPKTLSLQRCGLFSDRHKMQTVLSTQAFGEREVENLRHGLTKQKDLNLDPLLGLIDRALVPQLGMEDFSRQSSRASFTLWQSFFPKAKPVVYIPLEELISLVLQEWFQDSSSLFSRLFFNKAESSLLEKRFLGVDGGFTAANKGSFLFWGLDPKGYRIHMQSLKGLLTSKNFRLEFSSASIISALQEKKIYPTSLVCFLVLLYCNITCVGGFNQTSWLAAIKEKFAELLESTGEAGEASRIRNAVTDNFAESNLAFLFQGQNSYKATGLDIYLQQEDMYKKYVDLSKSLTVGQSIETQLSEIYKVIVPEAQREFNISQITEHAVLKDNGTEELVRQVLK